MNGWAIVVSGLLGSWGGLFSNLAEPTRVKSSDLADLREDFNALNQRVNEMSMKLENCQNSQQQLLQSVQRLQEKHGEIVEGQSQTMQVKIESLATKLQATDQAQRVALQDLARQTQNAIQSLAKAVTVPAAMTSHHSETAATKVFSDDYPREGFAYTVQKGDTIASIARKQKSRSKDILNANRIAHPSKIRVGQVIFIPQKRS